MPFFYDSYESILACSKLGASCSCVVSYSGLVDNCLSGSRSRALDIWSDDDESYAQRARWTSLFRQCTSVSSTILYTNNQITKTWKQ